MERPTRGAKNLEELQVNGKHTMTVVTVTTIENVEIKLKVAH